MSKYTAADVAAAATWLVGTSDAEATIRDMLRAYAADLRERESLSDEIERLRVQLAGCGVIAMSNTRKSLTQQMPNRDAYGWSQSLQDVHDAVMREIVLREEREAAKGCVTDELLHGRLAPDYGELTEDGSGYFFTCDGLKRLIEAVLPMVGKVEVPEYRGYAHLGIGGYLLYASRAGEPAELVIVPATPEQAAGRTVGDLRYDSPETIAPESMAVRLRFENVAGLDALMQQLGILRATHFQESLTAAPTPPAKEE